MAREVTGKPGPDTFRTNTFAHEFDPFEDEPINHAVYSSNNTR